MIFVAWDERLRMQEPGGGWAVIGRPVSEWRLWKLDGALCVSAQFHLVSRTL